jgi:peroxiredoxin
MKRIRKMFSFLSIISLLISGCLTAKSSGEAPDFTLNTLDGKSIQLSSLKGKKILIDFWASWCPPCRRELVEINELLGEYAQDNYTVLAISVDKTKKAASSYIKKMGYSSMTVMHDNANVAQSYGVQGIPSLYLVDEKGQLIWSHVGSVDKAKLIEVLKLK